MAVDEVLDFARGDEVVVDILYAGLIEGCVGFAEVEGIFLWGKLLVLWIGMRRARGESEYVESIGIDVRRRKARFRLALGG